MDARTDTVIAKAVVDTEATKEADTHRITELENITQARYNKGELYAQIENIHEFIQGNRSFEDVINDYAVVYSSKINANKAWSWNRTIPGGGRLTKGQRSNIKKRAVEAGLIPNVKITIVAGMRYGFPDFGLAGVVKETIFLPKIFGKQLMRSSLDCLMQ